MKININKILYYLTFGVFITSLVPHAFAAEVIRSEEIMQKGTIEENSPMNSFHNINGLGQDYYKRQINADKPEIHIKSIGEIREEKKLEKQNKAIQKEEKTADLQIFCNEMEYFEDRGELEARGDVQITSPSGVKITSDNALYNKADNTLKLTGDIEMVNGNTTVSGEYMFVDLNEENALMDDPITRIDNLVINAKEGFAYSDRIENLNGNVALDKQVEMELYSQGFTRFGRAINDTRLVDFELKKQRSKPYKFKTKEIVIRPQINHDSLVMKDVDIYYGKRKILNVPSVEIFSDKEMSYSEVNFPLEFGSIKGMGTYLGMGYTFKLPKTYTLRLTPAITYGEDEVGVGLMGKLKSKRMDLEAGWATSTNDLIVDGYYNLSDKLRLDIGRHVYKNEWFLGGTRAGYIGQLVYDDSYYVKELADSIFRHRISGGYVADYKREHQEDDIKDGYRYRYQAELLKPIKSFGNEEQDLFIDFFAFAQTMATLYTETGDTTALIRVGPRIASRVKRWNSIIEASLSGVHGQSPYLFDEYRYGRQTISFDESVILNRFISLGYKGTITPQKDNRKGDLLTENRVYAVVGPEDFKVAFSYDMYRQNMHFDFLILLGTDNLDMQYEKMTILNPERLGNKQQKPSDLDLYKVKVPDMEDL